MNVQRHGIRFEQAREAFFDQLAQYVDADRTKKHGRHVSDLPPTTGCCTSCTWFEKVRYSV